MAMKYHYFLAVKLPLEVKSFLNKWVKAQKEKYPFKKWVHIEDYHITLAFLGFVEESMLTKIIESTEKILEDEKPFTLKLNEIGTFGSPKNPRIFWADVDQSDDLSRLQQKVYNQCIELGFQLDKKPFRPHITLARKWGSEAPYNQELVEQIRTEEGAPYSFNVDEIILYESRVEETPKYKEFASFLLKK